MEQMIDVLEREETTRSTNEERRAATRYPANVRVRCTPLRGDTPVIWTAQVRDLSALGVGLVLPQCPGLSVLLEIELTRKNGTFVRNVLARVVHEAQEPGQPAFVGCAFATEIADDELRLFDAGAVHPSGPDCRRWTRFPCNVETVCYTCDTAPGERRSGRILNISAGGIGLLLRCQFSEGTLLYFELPQEMNLADPKVLIRVVRVIEHNDGKWFLGCEFADRLDQDEVRSLVR